MALQPTQVVDHFYQALTTGAGRAGAGALLSEGVGWHAAHPVNDITGIDAFFSQYWDPIQRALPDLEYRPLVRVAGYYDGLEMDGDGAAGDWVNTTGYLVGTFTRSLFEIPPTGRTLFLRFGEIIRVEGGKIAEAFVIPDFLDAMTQAGVNPIRPSLGHPGLVMPPITLDGVVRPAGKKAETDKSMQLVRDMLDGLGRFDGKSLLSMDQERYWHEDFSWFGPGGIGTTRGLAGFRAHHQGPFLKAFPTRGVDRTKTLVADGAYVATGGWPHMTAEHLGGGWLGLAPSGAKLTMRVMDFWRREGDLLRENWVSIDMIQILEQCGLDVFGQLREMTGDPSEFIGQPIKFAD